MKSLGSRLTLRSPGASLAVLRLRAAGCQSIDAPRKSRDYRGRGEESHRRHGNRNLRGNVCFFNSRIERESIFGMGDNGQITKAA